eukprot:g18603.t1
MRRGRSQAHLEEGTSPAPAGGAVGGVRWLCWGQGSAAARQGADGAGLVSRPIRRRVVRSAICLACLSGFGLSWWTLGGGAGGRGRGWNAVSNFRLSDGFLRNSQEGTHTSSGGQSLNGMLTLLEGSSEDLPVEAMRDYLNGLVEESASRKSEQLSNIAFIKTHKTASTTLASILYRYGMRHNSAIAKFREGGTYVDLDSATKQIAEQGRRVDIMHYHHAWNGFYSGTWDQAKVKYSKIMSEEDDVNYVTVLREPVAHYLSYYYYFLNPINKVPIDEYLLKNPHKKLLYNPLAAEFGIENMNQMNEFINNQLPKFKMVLLTERFDEGLALLQRMLQWDPIDMTYCKMLQTKKGERRWDGKPLENVPKISDLAPAILSHIKARTQLDSKLYQAGISLHRKYKLEFGPGVDEHFQAFQGLQKVMHRYLDVNTSSDALKWYVGDVDIYDNGPPILQF